MTSFARIRPLPLALALAAASLSGGCSTVESLVPSPAKGDSGYVNPSVRETGADATQMANAPSGAQDKVVRLPLAGEDLYCPTVDIADGGAAFRSGGADNASVRFQFNIVKTARECQPAGAQASIKVGVSGNLLIGPAGSAGAYSAPLRITVRRESDQKPVFDKAYRVDAKADAGLQGKFELVTEPIMVAMTNADLASNYTITVGFGGGANAAVRPTKRRHAQ